MQWPREKEHCKTLEGKLDWTTNTPQKISTTKNNKSKNKNKQTNKQTNRNRVNSDVPEVQAVPALQVGIYQENGVHRTRITECLCYRLPRICSVCHSKIPPFSRSWIFTEYELSSYFNMSNTVEAISGAKTSNPTGVPVFTHGY